MSTHQGQVFFEVIRWQFTRFQNNDRRLSFFNSYQKCCVYVTIAQHYYGFDFKLTSDAKIQPVFLEYRRGRPFLTTVTCRSRSTSNFMLWLVKIWQVSSCVKFMLHILKVVYFDRWSWQSFESTCDVFDCLFFECTKGNTAAIKSLLLLMAGLFIGFLVEKCVACQSLLSDFGWHRFCFSPCWMRTRIIKAQAILDLLDSFQELHLEMW